MEFLKKMKSRETVETVLKTIAAVVLGIVLIFLMERMIYGIYMDKINENTATNFTNGQCVAYCEEVGDDEFKVYLHDTVSGSWSVRSATYSNAQILNDKYELVVYRTPNAFDVSINNTHYIVMAVFIAGILGYFGWRFYKLSSDYKKLEKKFKKTGKIFA